MTQDPPRASKANIHSSLAVLINTIVGGIIGAAFGALGSPISWILGGLLVGAGFGLLNEALFRRARWLARWYRLRSVILVLGEALLVFYLVFPAYGTYHATHPVRTPLTTSPAALGMAYEDVAMRTADGVTLRGWYIPSENGAAIIAVHGADGNRQQMLRHAQVLSEAGYGVLLFDLRAHGESDGRLFPVPDDSSDVAAAVAYLHTRPEVDPERMGAVGLSRGAEVILQAGARNYSLKALVADGASTNRIDDLLPLPREFRIMYLAAPTWWMSDRIVELITGIPTTPLLEQVARIAPRPILFISSNAEPEPFVNRRLAERAGAAAQLWELPDTGHVAGISVHPTEYRQRMVSFFDAALLGRETTAP